MATSLAKPKAFSVWFKDLAQWDIKTAKAVQFNRSHPDFHPLEEFAEEVNDLVRPWEKPEKEWPVYGVNNETGVFFSHKQKGKAFNAPYKRISRDWFFHNPTRANVGSLGRVPEVPLDAITSPEYQVWRIREGLASDFMEVLLHTGLFQAQIQFHRVGAVKERLFAQNLLQIRIPVVPMGLQESVVKLWRSAQADAATSRERVAKLEAEIPLAIYKALGTPQPKTGEAMPKLLVFWWKELERWSFNYLSRARQGLLGFTKSRFRIQPLGQHIVETMNGYCIKPIQTPTPHKMLKLNALTPGGVDVIEAKFVKVTERVATHFHLRKDDLLICRSVGSYEHVAKCALVEEDRPDRLFPDIIIRARFGKGILPEFAREVIQTPLGRSYFQSNARTAVGMWKIGAEDIRNFPIPVPPLKIQQDIVEMVSNQRRRIAEERKRAEARQAQAARDVEEMILGSSGMMR